MKKYKLGPKGPPRHSFLRRYYDSLKGSVGTKEFTEKRAIEIFYKMACSAGARNRFNSLVAGGFIKEET